ncbi:MAG: alpha-amylase family glycosyl hydrolase [Nitrospiraceae bacterium]|nr:alpha-amylase family glycosyl hydrolase [Nitrospiraceae bacterium]
MNHSQKMHIYNLFPLLAGKFSQWGGHMKRAAEMGFNWIFVNPIQALGPSGSLYSISDYFSINPAFLDEKGRKPAKEQVRDMVDEARGMGLRMMTDLVVNHCSTDSELLKTHPEWFQWDSKGHVMHPFALEDGKKVVWKDLAKFNYGINGRGKGKKKVQPAKDGEGLYRFFESVVEDLIRMGFEAFRCDAAYQVPKSFWERLLKETRQRHPQVLFLAETLGCPPEQTRRTAAAGFDYIFNSSKWWDFKSPWLVEQYTLTREIAPSISFPESHDTERLAQELDGSVEGLKQHYLFSALFSAGVMISMGFEFGFRKRLHVVNTTPEDWEETGIDLRGFIRKVNEIKASHGLFEEESPTAVLPYENRNLLVMWKASASDSEESLLILNKDFKEKQYFSAEAVQQFLQSGAAVADISPEYRLDYVAAPFEYDLRPGQGILFITQT